MTRDAIQSDAKATTRLTVEQHAALLNAIPAQVALLDNNGVILGLNEAWRRFATANVLQSSDFFVGQNYLGACEGAHGECADEAHAVAAGILFTRRISSASPTGLITSLNTAAKTGRTNIASRCQDGRYSHVLDRGHIVRDAAG